MTMAAFPVVLWAFSLGSFKHVCQLSVFSNLLSWLTQLVNPYDSKNVFRCSFTAANLWSPVVPMTNLPLTRLLLVGQVVTPTYQSPHTRRRILALALERLCFPSTVTFPWPINTLFNLSATETFLHCSHSEKSQYTFSLQHGNKVHFQVYRSLCLHQIQAQDHSTKVTKGHWGVLRSKPFWRTQTRNHRHKSHQSQPTLSWVRKILESCSTTYCFRNSLGRSKVGQGIDQIEHLTLAGVAQPPWRKKRYSSEKILHFWSQQILHFWS